MREFAGSARQVGEYLADEVLTALAPEVKHFLVCTSVLARFTPELCDAVLGREDSAAVLADLARSNMFLVSLDARGEWYRYHHLFGEVLQLELGQEAARELRRRAAAWCRAQGLVEEAIEYAAAAGDAEVVAELLIERHLEFIWGGRLGQLLGWVRWLPAELLVQHPVLPVSAAAAAAMLAAPDVEVERFLAVAERARRERPQLWVPYLEAGVQIVRADVIQRGEVGAAVGRGRRAVAAAQEGADVLSASALACLAQALFFAGELDETRRVAVQAVERPDAPDVPDAYVGCLGLLALVDGEQERTESAEAWARQALAFARQHFQADSWVASLAHLGLALACAPQDDSTRPSGKRYAASICDARHSPPSATRTHCSSSLRCGSRDRGWRAPPVTSSARNVRSPGFRIRDGCRRSRPRSSRLSSPLELTPAVANLWKNPVRPSSPCCGALRPVSPAARSARSSTSR